MSNGIIIAADVLDLGHLARLLNTTHDIPQVRGYKIGFSLSLRYGLPTVVDFIRGFSAEAQQMRLIYDHQKAGTDIPETGRHFAEVVKRSEIDDVILFPLAGVVTARKWIQECHTVGLNVLLGCLMTHSGFITGEGGLIEPENMIDIFCVGLEENVHGFVLPGVAKDLRVFELTEMLIRYLSKSRSSLTIYTPGIGTQGGSIAEFEAGLRPQDKYYPIIGRFITGAEDMRAATLQFVRE